MESVYTVESKLGIKATATQRSSYGVYAKNCFEYSIEVHGRHIVNIDTSPSMHEDCEKFVLGFLGKYAKGADLDATRSLDQWFHEGCRYWTIDGHVVAKSIGCDMRSKAKFTSMDLPDEANSVSERQKKSISIRKATGEIPQALIDYAKHFDLHHYRS